MSVAGVFLFAGGAFYITIIIMMVGWARGRARRSC